jgi:hypothetical protein
MIVFVINRWTQPQRWRAMQKHLAQFEGLTVYRWSGIEPDMVTVTEWAQPKVPEPHKRVAIIRAYRMLFEHLDSRLKQDGPWVILQDDMRLTTHPGRDMTRPLHLLGGYTRRGIVTDPTSHPHVCPRAFIATADAVSPMLDVLQDETQQLCTSWTSYLSADTCTWDRPPTAAFATALVAFRQ